ncbi:hypothetical protein B0A48_02967 [Cryoendolithus antarcticus]|uniref:DUF7603 domain-containing protein n=1 Tax=Cryoendolithus antarcticus TaxID=1507870 RepID=A0A1V8TLS1_9PEZI|nr:hypothetical protein B0A48_02967 [Cryoendolithus antarcticus]
MVHSTSSSLADDYYTYTADDLTPTDSSAAADAYYLDDDDQHHDQLPQHQTLPLASHRVQPLSAVRKQTSLANITVPSFSAFRSQAASIPAHRHPAAFLHSPRPISFSAVEQPSPRLTEPISRPLSLDSELPLYSGGVSGVPSPPDTLGSKRGSLHRSSFPAKAHSRGVSIDSRMLDSGTPPSPPRILRRSSIPVHAKYADEQTTSHAPKQSVSSLSSGSQYSARPQSMGDHQQAPSMTLNYNGVQRELSEESIGSRNSQQHQKSVSYTQKGLGVLFGWKSSPQKSGTESPTTTFSDRSLSPAPSPHLRKPSLMDHQNGSARLTPPALDVQKANARGSTDYGRLGTPSMHGGAEMQEQVQELEQELTHISEELANSIRREMELEDELDRLKLEMPSLPDQGRRTSDYFSDSGTSSTKYPVADPEAKIESLERLRRKAEQDKAVMQAESAQRLQAESVRRREVEQYAQSLEEQLHQRSLHDEERSYMDNRLGDLESTLDETKRRLGQEKEARNGIEDLYSATRDELEQHRNERDNLRDELLPQLKSRVEGLEAEAADTQALMYENTRLQQELHALRETHESQRSIGLSTSFHSIAEESSDFAPSPTGFGLNRSGSLARNGSKRGGSLTRSGSVKDREGGKARSGSVSAGGVHSAGPLGLEAQKEIEDQRDALHKALKLLINRYEKQQRDHERAIKKMVAAQVPTGKGVRISAPKRSHYRREVSYLKEEVTTLRKRTEDALESKWQYERGLGGVKMDLDRAAQETRSLRTLLEDDDVAPALASRLQAAIKAGEAEQSASTSAIARTQSRLHALEDELLAAQQFSEIKLAVHETETRRIDEAASHRLERLAAPTPSPQATSPLLKKSPKLGVEQQGGLSGKSDMRGLEDRVRELETAVRDAETEAQEVVAKVQARLVEIESLRAERE